MTTMVSRDDFQASIDQMLAELVTLPDSWNDAHVETVAARLEGLHFTPPVITPVAQFLRLRKNTLRQEFDRIAGLPEPAEKTLLAENWLEAQLGYLQVLMFYYKKLLALRAGDGEEWDEIDELYVHD
jgi:hypothetical protein